MSVIVLFEDNHIIAVDKRSGQTVQSEPGKPLSLEEEVKIFLKKKYAKPGDVFLGVIHRLDMPVSGIVLFAKTTKALTRMNKIFEKREIQKQYTAAVANKPAVIEALITHWLKRDDKHHRVKAFEQETSGCEKAQLIYRLEQSVKKMHIIKIDLLTGRKHQIRAQLSAIGCPIIGDTKYGSNQPLPQGKILLHASSIVFKHPVSELDINIQSVPDFV
jgi:23S rRNA pseudouridine1911/1915/1917 synthase